jgi:prepilin-type N-terminal cleavage/methylation domain-containing protein
MSRTARCGFTRIELLVVIAIIGILLGFLFPPVRRVREAAARIQCANNLKQIGLALHNYHNTNKKFPPGCIGAEATPESRLSWMVALLPYLEQDNLYQQIDLKKGYAGNLPTVETGIALFLCPESKEAATVDAVTHYVAMSGIGLDAAWRPADAPGNGFLGYDRLTTIKMIKDGSSSTIALMETRSGLGPWARGGSSNVRGFDPADQPLCGDDRPFGRHQYRNGIFEYREGMNALLVDGSVHFFRSTIDPMNLATMITIASGEPAVNLD